MQEPDVCLEDDEDPDASNLSEIEEVKKSLRIGGKVHRGSFFFVVNEDFYSIGGTKIGAQQIHMLEMRVGVRRVRPDWPAIDLNRRDPSRYG